MSVDERAHADQPPALESKVLLDAAPGIHLVTDARGRILHATGADMDALGVRPGSVVGRPLLHHVLSSSRDVVRAALDSGRGTERPVPVQMRGRDALFEATFELRRPANSELLCWTIVFRDPVRRAATGAPARAEEQLAGAFDRLHQGIVIVDAQLRVLVANAAARALLGAALRAGSRLPAEEQDLRELAARTFAAADVQHGERGRDTEIVRVAGVPPRAPGDSAVLVLTPVGERERLELVEREFVANASHELRTPLATISAAIEILQGGAKEIPEARDRFLNHIEREATRLGRLVNALLTLARVQAGHELPDVARLRVRPLLDEAAATLKPQEGVEVVVACSPRLHVLAHPELLLEIVMNLAANAAKYTTEGRIVLAGVAHRRTVLIEVRDTGPGIAADSLALLFERFYRGDDRRGEGFGLGLAIVRQAVTALGGSIEVDSEPGSGTTVRVILPQPVTSEKEAAA